MNEITFSFDVSKLCFQNIMIAKIEYGLTRTNVLYIFAIHSRYSQGKKPILITCFIIFQINYQGYFIKEIR